MAMDKQQALDMALAQIEKQYGKGAIMKLGDAAAATGLSVIPTGCLELDIALGVGGIPRGRIVEVYGLKDMILDPVAYFLVLASSFVPILNFPIGMKYFQIGVLYTDTEFVQCMYACAEEDDDNDGQGN